MVFEEVDYQGECKRRESPCVSPKGKSAFVVGIEGEVPIGGDLGTRRKDGKVKEGDAKIECRPVVNYWKEMARML